MVLKKCLGDLTTHTSKVDMKKTDVGDFIKIARTAHASITQVVLVHEDTGRTSSL